MSEKNKFPRHFNYVSSSTASSSPDDSFLSGTLPQRTDSLIPEKWLARNVLNNKQNCWKKQHTYMIWSRKSGKTSSNLCCCGTKTSQMRFLSKSNYQSKSGREQNSADPLAYCYFSSFPSKLEYLGRNSSNIRLLCSSLRLDLRGWGLHISWKLLLVRR